jgi:hypothetical protein
MYANDGFLPNYSPARLRAIGDEGKQLPPASIFVLALAFYEGTGSCAVRRHPAKDRQLTERVRASRRLAET